MKHTQHHTKLHKVPKKESLFYRFFLAEKPLGFTLIELLVVISIIGLLAAIVLASMNSARIAARDARRVADMRQLVNAISIYYSNYGVYPATMSHFDYSTDANFFNTLVGAGIIAKSPLDPINAGEYVYGYTSINGGSSSWLGVSCQDFSMNNAAVLTFKLERGPSNGYIVFDFGGVNGINSICFKS